MLGTSITKESIKRLQSMIINFCQKEDGVLKSDIDLRKYAQDAGEVVTNATVQELVTIHPNLKKLDLSFCSEISDVGVWAIAKHCTGILELILAGCDKMTNVGIRSLSLTCSRLMALDMSDCVLLDDVTLTVVAAGSWRIQNIRFKNCRGITDNGVVKVAQGLALHLRVLDLSGCTLVGDFGDRGLKEIGANCPNLTELYYDAARRVEDGGVVAIANGCPKLEVLKMAGLHNMTKKGFKAICKNLGCLLTLTLIGMKKVSDKDLDALQNSPLQDSLTSLNLSSCAKLGDRGVGAICQSVGPGLHSLHLPQCPLLTDYSGTIISNLCPKLRELNLTFCGKITDDTVHSLARRLTCMTTLQLDGNGRVSTRALLSHVGKDLEFVEMANKWLGYHPKGDVEELILAKEQFIIHTRKALTIQSAIRRKFAMRIYWELYRDRLMTIVIPWFQATVRGVQQRKRYKVILEMVRRTRMAIVIQAAWRKHHAYDERVRRVKEIRLRALRQRLAGLIQKRYWGWKGRRRVLVVRDQQANRRMVEARQQAEVEIKAIVIQRVWKGWRDKGVVYRLAEEKEARIQHLRHIERQHRIIQRIARGRLGRVRSRDRRIYLAWQEHCFMQAIEVQRVYRGHRGRERWKWLYDQEIKRVRNAAAIQIQRIYRGYRGQILGAIARALKILRTKHQHYSVEIQRFARGCMGRARFKRHQDQVLKRRREVTASMVIQRLYRGHKGREAYDIEKALQEMESKAKPLILLLKHAEEKAVDMEKQLKRLEWEDGNYASSLGEIRKEVDLCERTTAKYMDSHRINNTPQRFMTKFLKVRLKDFLEHEGEMQRLKHIEVNTKKADLRNMNREIDGARRELIPLTTGLVFDVKRKRAKELRRRVLLKKSSATLIQKLWRRALVLSSLYDEHYSTWQRRWDKDQSDRPYYLNLESKEVVWTKPLAYTYFGDLATR